MKFETNYQNYLLIWLKTGGQEGNSPSGSVFDFDDMKWMDSSMCKNACVWSIDVIDE